MFKRNINRAPRKIPGALYRLFGEEPARGQGLVEYALITVLVVLAIVAALAATGPAIGNIFSDTVWSLLGAAQPQASPVSATDFWNTVTAVASFTPGSVIIPTNTPAPPTPTPTLGPSPTFTPVTPTQTSTATPTTGPSPTPADIHHNAPFYDNISDPSWWRMETEAVFAGYNNWNVNWWTYSGTSSTAPANATAVMSTPPQGTCTLAYDQPLDFNWGTGAPAPAPGCTASQSNRIAIRWTRTVVFGSDSNLILRIAYNDGMRVYVDSTLVFQSWAAYNSGSTTIPYTFTAGSHDIVVEYMEYRDSASATFVLQFPTDNVGDCRWAMSNEYIHGSDGSLAWNDTPAANYSNNTQCFVTLRGTVNLAPLPLPPRMTFWNRWQLANYDRAWLQVRDYDNQGAGWQTQLLHRGYEQQTSWAFSRIDLASYDVTDGNGNVLSTVDWTGKRIEFRFLLETDSSSTDNGWWIDDITIEENEENIYTIGFSDNMELANDPNWLPGGSWAISGEYTRSGTGAWSDSPGANYTSNTNSSLELNGVVDVTGAVDPELVFYHRWQMASVDQLFVEVSTDGSSWTPLTGGPIVTGSSSNTTFVRQALSLTPYKATPFYLRFRIQTDNSSNSQGWWIDDIALQEHPSGYMPYPFFDNVEAGGTYWLPDGTWTISPEHAYSGSSAWSDSPGTNYVHGTNTSLQTVLPFLLSPSAATNPELSFWYARYLHQYDKLYVEVLREGQPSWEVVWSFEHNGSSSAPPFAPDNSWSEFNYVYSFEYVSINMAAYISDTVPIYVRFRLDALTDTDVSDGVWLDDIRMAEHVETPHSFPFSDDMESTTKWRAGDGWTLHNEASHSGTYAWSDSPALDYGNNWWAVLELINPVNLTGVTSADFPVLYWWDRFSLDNYDYARVQVSTWTGPDWDDWTAWTEVYRHDYSEDTMSWDRRVVDLRPYAGSQIRLRFVLDTLQNTAVDPGWWIDDVSIERYNLRVFATDFYDGAETLSNWVTEGTWGLGSIFRGTGSGPASIGPGSWTTRFYDLREFGSTCGTSDSTLADRAIQGVQFWCYGVQVTFSPQYTVALGEIDYDCDSTRSPNPLAAPSSVCSTTPWASSGHDHIAIVASRTITVEAGTYLFNLTHDDGARLYIDSTRVINKWYDTGRRTDTYSAPLTTGTHTIEVWFYENNGDAVFQLDIARQSFSFHDSPGNPDVDYQHLDNMALILDGVLDMTGTVNPALTWYQVYDIDNYDCIVVEVSLPFVSGQFGQWMEVYRVCGRTDNLTWLQENIPLRPVLQPVLGSGFSFNNVKLALRFRLDARNNTATDPGWWIDDIVVAD